MKGQEKKILAREDKIVNFLLERDGNDTCTIFFDIKNYIFNSGIWDLQKIFLI